MRRLRIALDCDGVLADFHAEAVSFANEQTSVGKSDSNRHQYTKEQITGWNMFNAWGLQHLEKAFDKWIAEPKRVAEMAELPEAQTLVAGLRAMGEVVCVTSPYKGCYHWIPERIEWLREHFGFTPDEVCPWARKEWIAADVLVDDATHNVQRFAAEHDAALCVLLDKPWNQDCACATHDCYPERRTGIVRCFNVGEVLATVANARRFA